MDLERVVGLLNSHGLAYRGAFYPDPADGVPALPDGTQVATLLLLGLVGSATWPDFAASPEARDGAPDPLDRWSRRVIDGLAAASGATPLYPFGGPPYLPFQRWARKAEPVHSSPLGVLIHPDWGLWHSYRGALAFRERLALPPRDERPSPCDACAEKPCLSTCPVGAFAEGRYDTVSCVRHIGTPAGQDCIDLGCRARRACPIGAAHRLAPDQAAFHMRAFQAALR
jgi:hypothetical protein